MPAKGDLVSSYCDTFRKVNIMVQEEQWEELVDYLNEGYQNHSELSNFINA